ncbi:MAG: hypothetical protein JKY87_03005 [Mariprofundus sp.]|nr:hypothetical protein [Mariprofundus sp.]
MVNDSVMSDVVLSVIVAFGMLQMVWFSVMLVRRGVSPTMIQQAIPPFLAVWVLMWPVYVDVRWLAVGLFILAIPIALAAVVKSPFWQHLRIAWGGQDSVSKDTTHPHVTLLPQLHLLFSLAVAGAWFQTIPEFGFGLALCLCVAFPAAYWVDYVSQRYGFFVLGFPAHPEQTLAGHLILIVMCTILLCWSLHVYHGTDWQLLLIATLIVSIVASACRAIVAKQWNAFVAMLGMGAVMWLL